MNSSISRFSLDMHSAQSQISIPVLLGDTGRTFHISLSDWGNPYIIADGCLAKLSIKRPTGSRLEEFCAIKDNTTIVYDFRQNENTCAVEGIHECDVTLYGLDKEILTTARFTMVVNERVVAVDDVVLTDEDFTAVDAMLLAEASRQNAEAERKSAEEERVANESNRKRTAEALEEALTQAEEARKASKASETEAKKSETNAKASETNAKNAESNAQASANIATASATSAKSDAEIARQYASNTENIEARIARNSKRITNLERGQVPDPFETDDSVAYEKIVPIESLPFAEVSKVGGMSHRDTATNTLKDVKVTEVKSIGANLIPYPYRFGGSITQNGITVTANSDGSLTINGTSTGYCWIVCGSIETIVGAKYSMRAANCPNTVGMYAYYDNNDTNLFRDIPTVLTAKQSYYTLVLSVDAGNTFTKQTIYPMINTGATALPFAPYKCDTRAIPSEVQALEGYGMGVDATYCNHISWSEDGAKKWNTMVQKKVFTGNEAVSVYSGKDGAGKYASLAKISDPVQTSQSLLYPIICNKYNSVTGVDVYHLVTGCAADQFDNILFYDSDLQTAAAWKAKLKEWYDAGEPLEIVYAIKTIKSTDISDLITSDNMLEVEGGGIIVAENENRLSVPSTVTYQLKGDYE